MPIRPLTWRLGLRDDARLLVQRAHHPTLEANLVLDVVDLGCFRAIHQVSGLEADALQVEEPGAGGVEPPEEVAAARRSAAKPSELALDTRQAPPRVRAAWTLVCRHVRPQPRGEDPGLEPLLQLVELIEDLDQEPLLSFDLSPGLQLLRPGSVQPVSRVDQVLLDRRQAAHEVLRPELEMVDAGLDRLRLEVEVLSLPLK